MSYKMETTPKNKRRNPADEPLQISQEKQGGKGFLFCVEGQKKKKKEGWGGELGALGRRR
jgi:hypothetical protein